MIVKYIDAAWVMGWTAVRHIIEETKDGRIW